MVVMMFNAHIAFAVQLIALGVGALVYTKGVDKKIGFVRGVGMIIMILALISILCTVYYSYLYWSAASSMMNAHPMMSGAAQPMPMPMPAAAS